MECSLFKTQVIQQEQTKWKITIDLPKQKCMIHINGSTQDCSNSIANAMELLQSCIKPSIWIVYALSPVPKICIVNGLALLPDAYQARCQGVQLGPIYASSGWYCLTECTNYWCKGMSNGRLFCALTHWESDKKAAILQMAFLNEFSIMKIQVIWIKCDWSLLLFHVGCNHISLPQLCNNSLAKPSLD